MKVSFWQFLYINIQGPAKRYQWDRDEQIRVSCFKDHATYWVGPSDTQLSKYKATPRKNTQKHDSSEKGKIKLQLDKQG